MKLEVGKKYKTKSGNIVDIVASRPTYGGQETRYLGVLSNTLPENFWYTETGRLYNNGISPFDLESELQTKLEFKTKLRFTEEGKLIAKWPKELMLDFMGQEVKITVERI